MTSLSRSIMGIVLLPLCCAAVKPYVPTLADPMLEPWRWRHEEALKGIGAICMDEAQDGTLWFGGAGCIASYDGQRVERIAFDEEMLSRISHERIIPWAKALLLMEDGSPLVLVGESLVHWKGGEWRVVVQNIGHSVFSCKLIPADDGCFWVLVPGALWRVAADLSGADKVIQVSGQGELATFCLDGSGNVWVVERTGDAVPQLTHVPLVDGIAASAEEWRRYRVPSEHTMNDTHLIYGGDGLVWYADSSRTSGLLAFDPLRGQWLEKTTPDIPVGVSSLICSQDGSIWGGLEGGLVHQSKDGDLQVYPRGTLGLPLVPVSLFETRNNRLWVIGRVGYVYSVDLGMQEWMSLEGLQYHCETPDGKQWFTSLEISIVSHDPRTGEWQEYGIEDVGFARVFSLATSSHGLLWATGRHEGGAAISVFDGNRWHLLSHPDFARWVEPRGMIETADGSMWFGAGGRLLSDVPGAGGILRYGVDGRTGRVNLLGRHAPPDFPYYATAFAQTPDGALWIGSTLVYQLQKGTTKPVPIRGLGGENTVSMAVDHEGVLWVAKEHFGVSRWRGTGWEVFSTEDGVASLLLSDLLVMPDGSLLASSDGGISRFDGKSWTSLAYPEQFGMVKRWSGMKLSPDGSIWLNYCDDELKSPLLLQGNNQRYGTVRHKPETIPPETRIVECLKKVAQPGNTHIKWTARDPWGQTASELLQYSWRLDGGEWSSFDHDTSKTFLNLPHGGHVLDVCSRDRAFNVDPTPDRVEFLVVAPLWLQPWFVAMVMLMIGGTGLLIWTMVFFHDKRLKDRQRHLVEMDRLKTSFFTNLSHELRTPLSVMLSPLESLLRTETNAAKREKLSMVIRSAERVRVLLTQLLDFRKLEQGRMTMDLSMGDVVEPVRAVVELLQPMAEAHRVQCHLECPAGHSGWFDGDKLKKIASNLVGNAIKYTRPGGTVRVCLDFSADASGREMLLLVVEDSGAGIEPEHLEHIFDRFFRGSEKTAVDGSGIGLNLAKELVVLWGGKIRAESPIHRDPERPGTRFVVELPIGKEGASEGKDQRGV